VYQRNSKIEDRLGVKFTEYLADEWKGAFADAQVLLAAGDDFYDIYYLVDRNALTVAQEGYVEPMQNLPYVDLTREYWAQDLNRDVSIGGNLYFSYGDFNLTSYDMVSIMLVNQQLAEDFAFENHYDMVIDGSWTLEKMREYMVGVTSDVNGDSVMDENDMYGISAIAKQVLPCFWISSDLRTIEKDADDMPYFALEGNEKFAELYEKILNMMWSDSVYIKTSGTPDKVFADGRALYNIVRMAYMNYYREIDPNFAIIPFPKFDENQSDYIARIEGGGQVSFVSKVSATKEMAGAVMELMAYESRETVIPAYYDMVLKSKYARDERSEEMLDIIYGNRVCDLGDSIWTDLIRDGVFAGKFSNNDRNLQSTIESMKPRVEAAIEACIECFDEIETN